MEFYEDLDLTADENFTELLERTNNEFKLSGFNRTLDRDFDFTVTNSQFVQFSKEIFPIFLEDKLSKIDIKVLFFLLNHLQPHGFVVLPKYKEIANPSAPDADVNTLSISVRRLSMSLKTLQDNDLILKVKVGVFMFNPQYISAENLLNKSRTSRRYEIYKDEISKAKAKRQKDLEERKTEAEAKKIRAKAKARAKSRINARSMAKTKTGARVRVRARGIKKDEV
jgi:hypothetical protein